MTELQLIFLVVCAILVGFAKTGITGSGILVPVLLIEVMPANESVGFLLPMLIVGDIAAVYWYKKEAVWEYVWKTLPLAFVGIVVGFFIFDFVQQNDAVPLLKRMIGATVLFILALHFWLKRRSTDQGTPQIPKLLRAPWCIAGGIATMLANAAGPIMTVYMLSFRLTKEQFLGTMGWLFLILNVSKIPLHVKLGTITTESLTQNVMLVPAIAFGGFIGIKIVKKINQESFNRFVLVLAAIAAIRLTFF